MDAENRKLFNILRIAGPIVFFVVVFLVVYFMTDLGAMIAFGVAAAIAIVDFVALTWLMGRVAK